MSEQQVLPEFDPKKVERYFDARDENGDLYLASSNFPMDSKDERGADWILASDYDKLLASLAQSEAERERLQEWAKQWHKVVEVALTVRGLSPALGAEEASAALTDDIEARKESWTFADEEQIVDLRAGLAREREANQGLRQIVNQYRDEHTRNWYCGTKTNNCPICIKADALLEPKAEPVATTS